MSFVTSPARLGTLVLGLALAMTAAPATFAQQPTPQQMAAMAGQVNGVVVDQESGEPLALATVAVYQNGEFVTGAATAADGTFDVSPLRPGTYEVRISSVGFETHRVEDVAVRPGSPVALGTIRLSPATAQLGEAEVVGERDFMEVRADRTVYNVAEQPVTTGGDALEMLQTLPSLEVDLDGNIALRGNQNVAIHMNGRPVPMRGDQLTAFLRQLPADQVERVEVLPNPSARYEADSMAGIINIVLKQGVSRGLSGGLTVGGGTAPSANVSGNVAYQEGPVDVYASYGFRYDDRTFDGGTFRDTPLRDPRFMDQEMANTRTGLSHFFNSTLDYRLRQGLNLTAGATLSARSGANDAVTLYRYFDSDFDEQDLFRRITDGETTGYNASGNIGLKRAWTPQRHELTTELRYSYNTSEDESRIFQERPGETLPRQELANLDNATASVSGQVDYQRPLGDGRFEIGGRASLRQITTDRVGFFTNTDTGATIPAPGRTNTFEYDETVLASYLQGAYPFGDFELQLGARLEHTQTDFELSTTGDTFERSYTDIFPSAFVSYTPWLGGTVRAGYSRRVNRPWPQQLNPFESFEDTLNVRRGNPELQPEFIDSFELTASQFLPFGTVSLTPFYRRTNNVIRPRFLYDPETNVQTMTMENLDTDDSYGADLTLAARLGQQLTGFVSGSLYRTVTSAGSIETGLGTDALAWTVRANVTSRLRQGLTAQMFGFYRSPMKSIDGEMSGFAMTSIGLRQQLMNERASLSLRVTDPLGMSRFEFTSTRPEFFQEGFRDPNMRRVDLSFTYTFGQVSQQQRRQRQQQDVPEVPQDDFGF